MTDGGASFLLQLFVVFGRSLRERKRREAGSMVAGGLASAFTLSKAAFGGLLQ